jgi:hypothetical protein
VFGLCIDEFEMDLGKSTRLQIWVIFRSAGF